MTEYNLVDLQTEAIDPNFRTGERGQPELAAAQALGLQLVRSGQKHNVRAHVCFQNPDQPRCMVRLYTKAAGIRNEKAACCVVHRLRLSDVSAMGTLPAPTIRQAFLDNAQAHYRFRRRLPLFTLRVAGAN